MSATSQNNGGGGGNENWRRNRKRKKICNESKLKIMANGVISGVSAWRQRGGGSVSAKSALKMARAQLAS
jgi:hypothetical protein